MNGATGRSVGVLESVVIGTARRITGRKLVGRSMVLKEQNPSTRIQGHASPRTVGGEGGDERTHQLLEDPLEECGQGGMGTKVSTGGRG